MTQRSRRPRSRRASPRLERRVGSGIQQSRMFTPAASAASTTVRASCGVPSIHSPPKPISLTLRPVRPSSR